MARYAILDKDNTVVNVSEWDGVTPWTPGEGLTAVLLPDNSPVEIDGTYTPKTKEFVPAEPPPEEPPSEIEQLRQVLIEKGVITKEDVAVAAEAAAIELP